jgi:hypothetical protein
MRTNNINFSTSDEVNVFASMRKLSDSAVGIFMELSATVNSNNGVF